jgi:hypothetical protein
MFSFLGEPAKMAKAKANALRMELVTKRTVDDETHADTWKMSKNRRKMNSWQDYISHKIHVSNKLDARFNFPKIHVMSHSVEQIRRYGALQPDFAERHEQAHNPNLKDGWNDSNHNLNYLPQVITFQCRILCFKV